MSRLGISPATARRDINKLDESGKLKKVRNGAEAISEQRPRWTPMNIHQAQNLDEKVRIARAASQLIAPGESIVINCGSTAAAHDNHAVMLLVDQVVSQRQIVGDDLHRFAAQFPTSGTVRQTGADHHQLSAAG